MLVVFLGHSEIMKRSQVSKAENVGLNYLGKPLLSETCFMYLRNRVNDPSALCDCEI